MTKLLQILVRCTLAVAISAAAEQQTYTEAFRRTAKRADLTEPLARPIAKAQAVFAPASPTTTLTSTTTKAPSNNPTDLPIQAPSSHLQALLDLHEEASEATGTRRHHWDRLESTPGQYLHPNVTSLGICTFTEHPNVCPTTLQDCNSSVSWHNTSCNVCGHCLRPVCNAAAAGSTCPSSQSACTTAVHKADCSKCQECVQYTCCGIYWDSAFSKWKTRCRDTQNNQESSVSKNKLLGTGSLCKQLEILIVVGWNCQMPRQAAPWNASNFSWAQATAFPDASMCSAATNKPADNINYQDYKCAFNCQYAKCSEFFRNPGAVDQKIYNRKGELTGQLECGASKTVSEQSTCSSEICGASDRSTCCVATPTSSPTVPLQPACSQSCSGCENGSGDGCNSYTGSCDWWHETDDDCWCDGVCIATSFDGSSGGCCTLNWKIVSAFICAGFVALLLIVGLSMWCYFVLCKTQPADSSSATIDESSATIDEEEARDPDVRCSQSQCAKGPYPCKQDLGEPVCLGAITLDLYGHQPKQI